LSESTESLLRPKIVAGKLGIDTDTLKNWVTEFNLQVQTTEGGHRRYSKQNIEELLEIKKKLHEQNWSYDMVKMWRNGEDPATIQPNTNLRSDLEKKMDLMLSELELLKQQNELQKEFNQQLVKKLDQMGQQLTTHIENSVQRIEQKEEKKKRTGWLRIFSTRK